MTAGVGRGGRWDVVIAIVGLAVLAGWSVAADRTEKGNPTSASSARSKLEAARKAREKEEAAQPRAARKVASQPAAYPWATPDDVNYIDRILKEEHEATGFAVAKETPDAVFVRRVYLDIIGRTPTYDELMAYLKDESKDRKERLVNELLASEDYGEHWANIWNDLIRLTGPNAQRSPLGEMRAWFEKEFNRNRPWNEMVHDLIAANGRSDENGAVNFVISKRVRGMETTVTSTLTKLFLAVQSQCTECHNHPWNEWKQNQFHGIDAFFLGTRVQEVRVTAPNGRLVTDHWELSEVPYQQLSEKGKYFEDRAALSFYVTPTYIDGRDVGALRRGEPARPKNYDPLKGPGAENFTFRFDDQLGDVNAGQEVYLRQELAKVITANDNVYFAQAIVNRLWYNYFGHSFVKNVDDFDNGQDEPTIPTLLDRLSKDFRAHGYDLKRLTRWICTSEAYALASQPPGFARVNKGSPDAWKDTVGFFTFMLCKPMTPEQLYDSVMALTQYHKTSRTEDTSAERSRFVQEFRRTFGSDQLATTMPTFDGTITQGLMMMNSDLMTKATSAVPGTFLHRLVQDPNMSDKDRVEAIYLTALGRTPSGPEATEIGNIFREAGQKEALEDVLWAVLNSGEFVLNH